MSAPAVKICGVKSREALAAALDGKVRYIGFNFVAKSPRYIAPAEAAALCASVPSSTRTVALVADASDEDIANTLRIVKPDMVQLHGGEAPARVAAISEWTGLPVIKACPIATAEDVDAAFAFEPVAAHLLFDAKPPKGAAITGGHGVAFDWSLLSSRKPRAPWFLSGGLTPDNLAEAVRATQAPMVDVSSGVEVRRGEKDPGLIRAFLDTARGL